MGLIREPLNIDFYFEEKQMTDEDQKRVTLFIAKQKMAKQKAKAVRSVNKDQPLFNASRAK